MLGFRKSSSAQTPTERGGLLGKLRRGLARTRSGLSAGVADLLLGKKAIDEEFLEDLETLLLSADVGVDATTQIIGDLTARVARNELSDPAALLDALRTELLAILEPCSTPLAVDASARPFAILMVGINGAGKTTTIGKLARRLQAEGRSVMLAAGDTFRAAAVEQLQTWGKRNDVTVVAQHSGADSASVIYDALEAARARDADVLIADTAGRLHTQTNLMDELRKVKRVMGKLDAAAPHEVLLVVDAGTGQNALAQARQFDEAVGLTGIALTKLDGTAKGGIIFAIAHQMKIPIRFVGVGEGIEDLRPFNAEEFVDALFSSNEEQGSRN
ncbi:MAG: signal recognition particle-docking protein FtsY [Pseudomonadota bacterium]|nr:MAG: signal recognition particle-docking protein FtsY [Pseudomonadota bacterium]